MKKILALEFVEMRELLPEEWLPSVEQGDQDNHSCCNSAIKKRKPPVTNIFTWLQGYAALVGALSTAYPGKVPDLMAYQATILRCYRDFEGPAWVQYDRAYRRQAAITKNLNWSQLNTTLYSLCFAGRAKRNHICSHCLSNNHGSDACPEASFSTPRRSLPHHPHHPHHALQHPQRKNARGGPKCHCKACHFLHACSRCRGDHPASVCTGVKRDEPGDTILPGAKRPSSRPE